MLTIFIKNIPSLMPPLEIPYESLGMNNFSNRFTIPSWVFRKIYVLQLLLNNVFTTKNWLQVVSTIIETDWNFNMRIIWQNAYHAALLTISYYLFRFLIGNSILHQKRNENDESTLLHIQNVFLSTYATFKFLYPGK